MLTPGIILGVLFVESYGESIWFKRSLGVGYLVSLGCILFRYLYSSNRKVTDFNRQLRTFTSGIIITGSFLLSGILYGLDGTGGAPIMILALYFNLSRETYFASNFFSRIFIGVEVMLLLYFTGNHVNNKELYPLFLGISLGSLFGVAIGLQLAKYVSHDVYSKALEFILLLSAIEVIFDKTEAEFYAVAFVISLALFYSIFQWCKPHESSKCVEEKTLLSSNDENQALI